MADETYVFGSFQLVPAQRLLLNDGSPLRLGSRAFEILITLVECAGETVFKDQLIARVWPDTVVGEGTLRVHVAAVRKALGDGREGHRFIISYPGRGYSFVAPVTREQWQQEAPAQLPNQPARSGNLPALLTRAVGRDEVIATVVSRCSQHRLVTVVGPGGIGKTTVAIAAAEQMSASFADGIWFVGLATLVDAALVPAAVGAALGMPPTGADPLTALAAWSRDKHMLIVLDCCEHVADAAAALAEAVLRAAPHVCILATSREPLRAEGEWVLRLPSLEVPSCTAPLSAVKALSYSAVQLFGERAAAAIDGFVLSDADVPNVLKICRGLDGMPLALELAAVQVDALGIHGLAQGLTHRFDLLTRGRRTALAHQQTLRATMDWSYDFLPEVEKVVLRRLAVFRGGFTMEAASSVVGDADIRSFEVIEIIADLSQKSLVATDISGDITYHYLLDTTRAYALEKLTESREREAIAGRHAEYYRNLFERAEGEVAARPAGDWLADYAREIDNLRAALDWVSSPDGDVSIGVALTAAAVPLWMRLSLLKECRSRAKQALSALGTAGTRNQREEMRLHAALGASTSEAPEMGAAFTKVLDIAESLGDTDYQLRALRGLYFDHIGNSRYRAALPFAQKFHDLATSRSDPSDQLFGERMMGVAKHYVGDQISARCHLEQVLTYYGTDHTQDVIRFQIDSQLSARVFLARVLWLQGFSDQAVRTAEMSIGEAQATGHAISLCYVLSLAACPIALWVGNLVAAANYTTMLLDHSRRHSLPLWSAFGSRFQSVVDIKGGDLDTGLQLLQTDLDQIAGPNVSFRFLTGLAELAEALGHAGRIAEGLALIEAGIQQSEGGWLTPELLRLKGELFLLGSTPAVAETAEELFQWALDGARQQKALSWELRAATSLARVLCDQGRSAVAIACLQRVYDRFTEGFGTADLIAAKQLLSERGNAGRR